MLWLVGQKLVGGCACGLPCCCPPRLCASEVGLQRIKAEGHLVRVEALGAASKLCPL